MADEQYAWLDKEAAEKLLRGEPVDPAEGRPRQDAERLATALDAVARTARPATGELPGEAAALAAFRAVPRRPRTAGAAAAHGDDADAETAVLPPVHIGRAAGPRADRPFRWSRPLRFGLAASLACCAIGGVAVAAGSGMLPAPFGRHTPSPATSVSAAESPGELGTDVLPDEETSAPSPPGTPTPDAPAPGGRTDTDDDEDTARPGAGASHDDRKGKDDTAGAGRTGGSRTGGGTDSGDDASRDHGNEDPGKGNGHSGGDASGPWYAKTLQACRDYRDGTLDADRRTRLEALAKGARNLDRFCDRLLAAEEDKHGGGAGDAEQGGDASAPLPSIRFTESPNPSTAVVAPGPDPADSATEDPRPAASAAAR
ncbi:hypothetical protein ABZ565_11990 [Streptomyces sp. NPDC016469]|uniref:hypothetical protein n=1 Tax=Streptomyces sp. NPDC016469 TaxID=3157191 RepID=UPI0033CF63B2